MAFVAFPSLIGLLPMPGGAIFSAPMVEAASRSAKISPARATIANYWFRHIWEYWFPLYPGVILAVQLTGASTGKFMLLQAPLTLFSVAAGHVLILRGIRRNGERRRDFSRSIVARFIRELTPILIVVAAVVMLDPLAELAVRRMETDSMLARRLPILLGLVMACAWLIRFRGLRFSALGKLILKRNIAEMAFMAAGVMMFRAVLENSGAVAALQAELETWNVPVVAVVCALPFTAGIVIGLAFGYVAASFPLVIALLAAIPETERLPYYCLAYSFGYVGMMLSPVHLCLILTSEYFKSRLLRVYRYLLPLGLLTGVFAFALFLIYRVIF
jgi:integral membrane protein (TIGR00529 family)